jgi:hypothetical protein
MFDVGASLPGTRYLFKLPGWTIHFGLTTIQKLAALEEVLYISHLAAVFPEISARDLNRFSPCRRAKTARSWV